NAGVDEEMEPEGLERKEDKSRHPVQESEPQQIAITEQKKRPQQQRCAAIEPTQGPLALDGRAGPTARDLPLAAAVNRHCRLGLRPTQVPACPLIEGHAHVIDHRLRKATGPAAFRQKEML